MYLHGFKKIKFSFTFNFRFVLTISMCGALLTHCSSVVFAAARVGRAERAAGELVNG